jgi:hypothetical protein
MIGLSQCPDGRDRSKFDTSLKLLLLSDCPTVPTPKHTVTLGQRAVIGSWKFALLAQFGLYPADFGFAYAGLLFDLANGQTLTSKGRHSVGLDVM